MKNEFSAIFERDGDWIIGYCPRFRVPTDRGAPKKSAVAVWQLPLNLFWKTVAKA